MNDLKQKTCKELREIAKGLNIVGRWDMNKDELLEAIYIASLTDDDITFETDCIIKDSSKIQSEGLQKVTKTTADYLKDIKEGTLVAFKRSKEKDIAMSGKFVSFDDFGKVIVESKQGTTFTLNPECIIWVKTGGRWPKWVFSLFNKQSQEVRDDNAIS